MTVKGYDRRVPQSRLVHVLWSPQSGPICAYEDPIMAWNHAATMLGVEVTGVELRVELPEVARPTEYEDDDPTPVSVEDFDDAK
jgi:hypothetical protein